MKDVLKRGDVRKHSFVVDRNHFPDFGDRVVHPVCSTYVLAREIEWSTRLFMLDVIESDEEGIGTRLEIAHKSPAFEGEEVKIVARLESFERHYMSCDFEVWVEDRLIAVGTTGQKLMKREQLNRLHKRKEN